MGVEFFVLIFMYYDLALDPGLPIIWGSFLPEKKNPPRVGKMKDQVDI